VARTILVDIVKDQQPVTYKDPTRGILNYCLFFINYIYTLIKLVWNILHSKKPSFFEDSLHKNKCFKTRLHITNTKLEIGPFVSKNKGP